MKTENIFLAWKLPSSPLPVTPSPRLPASCLHSKQLAKCTRCSPSRPLRVSPLPAGEGLSFFAGIEAFKAQALSVAKAHPLASSTARWVPIRRTAPGDKPTVLPLPPSLSSASALAVPSPSITLPRELRPCSARKPALNSLALAGSGSCSTPAPAPRPLASAPPQP